MPKIKNFIKELAKERGKTQSQLAKHSNVSRTTLSILWRGETLLKEIHPVKLSKIAYGLNVGHEGTQLEWIDLIEIPLYPRIVYLALAMHEVVKNQAELNSAFDGMAKEMDKFLLLEEYEGGK